MMYRLLAIGVGAVAVATASSAGAVTRYQFSGTINDVRDFASTGVASYIPLGTAFSGTFDYDPDAQIDYLVTPDRAVFQAPPTPTSTVIGNYTFNKGSNQLQLINGNPGLYFLSSDQSDFSGLPSSLNGYEITTRIQLYGGISNLTLPRSLDLNNFPGFIGVTGYSLAGEPPSNFAWHVAGNITALNVVALPEPASWAMITLGMGAVGYAMRRSAIRFHGKFTRKVGNIA